MKQFLTLLFLLLSIISFAQNQGNAATRALLMMEEAVQRTNVIQVDRGSGWHQDVKEELYSTRGKDAKAKANKLKLVNEQMNRIDAAAGIIIDYIDELKLKLITASGEENRIAYQSGIEDDDDQNYSPVRCNLYQLPAPLNKVEFDASDELIEYITAYRNDLLQAVGTYKWGDRDFRVDNPGYIEYVNYQEYSQKVIEAFGPDSLYNYMEDQQVLLELYTLARNAETNVKTLQTGALLTNLSILTTLQFDILSARALAMAQWKSKVSIGEYSFNKVLPLVSGPTVVQQGENPEFEVVSGAIDTENHGVVKVTSHKNVKITYDENGVGHVVLIDPTLGEHIVKGTISIKNKSGLLSEEAWEMKVVVK